MNKIVLINFLFGAGPLNKLIIQPAQKVYRRYSSQSSVSESCMPNNRFWSKTVVVSYCNNSDSAIDQIDNILDTEIDIHSIRKPELGIVLIPKYSLLVPIHRGKLQRQRTIKIDLSDNLSTDGIDRATLTFCGFSEQVQEHLCSPAEVQRPIDYIRLEALDKALLNATDVTGEQLLSDYNYAGTSASRIYRSFVCPRPKSQLLETVDRAALRTATQITLALRQMRADAASYLRNTDRMIHLKNFNNYNNNHVEDNDTLNLQNNNISGSSFLTLSNTSITTISSSVEDISSSILQQCCHQEQLLQLYRNLPRNPVALILDNVRSAFNVGSIFRTAETAGAAEVVTCGITAHPPHPKLRKTAMTAIDIVPSRHFDDGLIAVQQLQSEAYSIVVLETTSRSECYTSVVYPDKVALVVGNEITGVDTRLIEIADIIVEIPMYGLKNSLNVASAASVVLFEVLRQWNVTKPNR